MTEFAYQATGGISLAVLLGMANVWLERKSGLWTRIAMKERLAHYLLASAYAQRARDKAFKEAMGMRVRLEGK